ncbi:MAG: leucine-rich repeat domain-containing protein, partial [Bacteroidales bacterium]|nr:leucine-rich repeat domain-containing protein [Bacteroidales bacterium]
SDCTNLTDIILPNSLKKIGWCAFAGCTGLTEIKIPNSVETIDDRAFADCTGTLHKRPVAGLLARATFHRLALRQEDRGRAI